MNETQYNVTKKVVEELMYSNLLGKSSLWLLGNFGMIVLIITIIAIFAVLNYKQRSFDNISENRVQLFFRFLINKLKPVKFYVEVGLSAGMFFWIGAGLNFVIALIGLTGYLLIRFPLWKFVVPLFRRKAGTAVPIGYHILLVITCLGVMGMFNVLPALLEVVSQQQVQEQQK